jgi:hypothetical protein
LHFSSSPWKERMISRKMADLFIRIYSYL